MPRLSSDAIDDLLALDPGGRGIAEFFQRGGARRAAQALQRARRVVITTGFVVKAGVSETDGPPGAAVLGRALRRLGASVRYITDDITAPVLAAAIGSLGESDDVTRFPARADAADAAREMLAHERPTHLVAIERPGRARDGVYRNMRGHDVSEWNTPIDELFVEAHRQRERRAGQGRTGVRSPVRLGQATHGTNRPRGPRYNSPRYDKSPVGRAPERVITIGVGDGGNEIGMGNVRARFARGGALAARIGSVVRVDHLVVAGVSNWGAYGIVAYLQRLAGQPLLHTHEDERRLVAACVDAGACDGVSRRREATVDGLSLDVHAALVTLLGVATNARA